jgi:hypothetical protein
MENEKDILIDIIDLKHKIIFDIISQDFNFWDASELAAVNSDLNEYFEEKFDGWKIKDLKDYILYLDDITEKALKQEEKREG